jgi:hypothetical protein
MPRAVPPERLGRHRDEEQAAGVVRTPPPPAERLVQLQRSAGNAAVARAILARNFDRRAYERSMAEKAKFMAWLWEGPSWRPSTGLGNFDVLYEPKTGLLTVTVKCRFKFVNGKAQEPDPDDEDGTSTLWDEASKLKWKTDFMRRVSNKWSDQFTFFCTRDWWEDLHAAVQVRFVESDAKHAHYDLRVTKVTETGDDDGQSKVRGPKGNQKKGRATLYSEDLIQTEKVHGDQTVAFHEAGHMLGLGDEYPNKKNKQKGIAHEKLVQAEFGHGVPRHQDGRLMSDGDLMMPEYGVTFLEALRAITAMEQWSHVAKPPAPVLSEPVDGPLPHKQDPLAPQPPQVALV